jgi:hypothetical protein
LWQFGRLCRRVSGSGTIAAAVEVLELTKGGADQKMHLTAKPGAILEPGDAGIGAAPDVP